MTATTNEAATGRWQFWIDRGGTFTDVVAKRPDGSVATHKLLSENPEQYRDAAIQGIRDTARPGQGRTRSRRPQIEAVKMGTTVATNALLERARANARYWSSPRASATPYASPIRTGRVCLTAIVILPELLYERGGRGRRAGIGADGEVLQAPRFGRRARRSRGRPWPMACVRHRDRVHARLSLPRAREGGGGSWPARSASPRSR